MAAVGLTRTPSYELPAPLAPNEMEQMLNEIFEFLISESAEEQISNIYVLSDALKDRPAMASSLLLGVIQESLAMNKLREDLRTHLFRPDCDQHIWLNSLMERIHEYIDAREVPKRATREELDQAVNEISRYILRPNVLPNFKEDLHFFAELIRTAEDLSEESRQIYFAPRTERLRFFLDCVQVIKRGPAQ